MNGSINAQLSLFFCAFWHCCCIQEFELYKHKKCKRPGRICRGDRLRNIPWMRLCKRLPKQKRSSLGPLSFLMLCQRPSITKGRHTMHMLVHFCRRDSTYPHSATLVQVYRRIGGRCKRKSRFYLGRERCSAKWDLIWRSGGPSCSLSRGECEWREHGELNLEILTRLSTGVPASHSPHRSSQWLLRKDAWVVHSPIPLGSV